MLNGCTPLWTAQSEAESRRARAVSVGGSGCFEVAGKEGSDKSNDADGSLIDVGRQPMMLGARRRQDTCRRLSAASAERKHQKSNDAQPRLSQKSSKIYLAPG